MRKLSSAEHAARLALYESGLPDTEIARHEGVLGSAIRNWRNNHGLTAHRTRGTVASLEKQRRTLLAEGWSLRRIERREGLRPGALTGWAKRRGLTSAHKCFRDQAPSVQPVIVSLDALVGAESFHALTPDPYWSEWLDRMGATVIAPPRRDARMLALF